MSNSNGISGYLSIVSIGGTLLPGLSVAKHPGPSNQILRCAQDDTPARYDRIAKKQKEGNCLK